jgi:steroid delta-isomerase-like uncharacterized protein
MKGITTMFITITRSHPTPEQFEQAEDFLHEFLPRLEQQPGVKDIYHFGGPGEATTIIVWDSESAIDAYRESALMQEALAFERDHDEVTTRERYAIRHAASQSEEENKAVVRQFIDQVANQGKVDQFYEFLSPEYLDHTGAAGQAPGIENSLRAAAMLRTAFPPWHTEIEDMIAEGDKVMFRGTSSGTHRGEFMGVAPTGKRVSISGVHIMRLSGGKIVEHWAYSDMMGFMRQLGLMPEPGRASS